MVENSAGMTGAVSDEGRRGAWAGYAAFAWTAVFIAFHVYWFAGGRLGFGSAPDPIPNPPSSVLGWIFNAVVFAMFVGGMVVPLALFRPWGRKISRWTLLALAWSGCAVLVMRGGAGIADSLLRATGVLPRGLTGLSYEQILGQAHPSAYTLWSGATIDAYFLIGGILFGIAARLYGGRPGTHIGLGGAPTAGKKPMTRRSRLVLLAGALLLLTLVSEGAEGQPRPSLDLDAVDRYIEQQMAANSVPGLALAITHGDEVVYLKGYGTAGNGEPMTPRTQLHIASLSKGFTALAVMQLVEEGRIRLDEPVRAYLPDFSTTDRRLSDQITVRELLNQTSGLADSGFPSYTMPQPDSLQERVESLRLARLVSKPGKEFHYTDPNYAVLARIVEVVSGKPFGEYLREHVFSPLDMDHTSSVLSSREATRTAPDLAQGHVVAFGVPIPHGEMDGFLGGSGGVISTAEDMANYLIMQNNGGRLGDTDLVNQKSISLMHKPPRGVDGSYAMGWTAPPGAKPRVIEHNGILSSFHSDAALLPERGYGVVLLYDQSYALADYAGTTQGVLDLLAGEMPDNGGLGAGKAGVILAALALVTTALQVRGLLRLRGWAAKTRGTPVWRLVPGIAWKFVPAALLVGLQPLVASFAGRVYNYPQLFWAMPDVVGWLILGAVLGGAAGVTRVLIIAQPFSAKIGH